ncbi:hypothetical protein [Tatumella saanichensis]|uniref:hypothetical protein n=1 Tax=Tatumella saanichensis TaxID=480813 RepID=UPI0004B5C609|nr:hypothetical protein [Tatumella saanichensis]
MSKISDRWKYTKIKEGYCLICGEYGKLSQDHVPPKCVVPPNKIEQRLITEFRNSDIKGVNANQGSVFKTICARCNNNLGKYDTEIKRVTNEINTKVNLYLKKPHSVYNTISMKVDADSYLRGMIGHVLSASPNTLCKEPRENIPFFKQLCDFVLGKNPNITDTHTFSYWFYPNRLNITGALFSLLNTTISGSERFSTGACIHFYPVAILVTEPNRVFNEITPFARVLSPTDTEIVLNLSTQYFNYSAFPFFSLSDTIVALNDACVTVSHAPVERKY